MPLEKYKYALLGIRVIVITLLGITYTKFILKMMRNLYKSRQNTSTSDYILLFESTYKVPSKYFHIFTYVRNGTNDRHTKLKHLLLCRLIHILKLDMHTFSNFDMIT